MIDLHCHILPCVDDGSCSLEESVKMAKIAESDGIKTVVATPHVCAPLRTVDVKSGVAKLQQEIKNNGLNINVVEGSENFHIMEIEDFKNYTLNKTSYVLIEFPHDFLPGHADKFLFELILNGIKPIVAHPERNATILKNPKFLEEFSEMGIVLQLTAGSITGEFGKDVQECSKYILKKRWGKVIATDAHSCEYRKPILSKAVNLTAKIIGKKDAEMMVTDFPEMILNGESIN